MQLYEETNSQLQVCLYPLEVRWTSRGKVVSRIFALSAELFKLLQYHNRHLNTSRGQAFFSPDLFFRHCWCP